MSKLERADKVKVLVLDDEVAFIDLCREFLSENEDLDADYVTSPAAALEMAGKVDYQVIVSDHTLPGMDGLQFLRALRSLRGRIPFILLTGNGREGLAIEALQSGADFYMQKAGSPRSMFEQLVGTIKALTAEGGGKAMECLLEPFEVFSKGGVLLVSNGGERVLAAAAR